MNPWTALALATAMISAVVTCGRRSAWMLGAYGPTLAPSFLLIVWFAFLGLGQWTGSLAGAGWVAATPLMMIAGFSVARTKRLRTSAFRWTMIDKSAFAFISLFLIAYCGNDNYCHYSVTGAYLRGNIPPTALNDPSRPLRYHGLFDAAAAMVTDASGVGVETALDLVSIACVFACLCSLQGLSRILYEGRWARQSARLFYLLGFGPIYLNHVGFLIARPGERPGSFLFHGHTTQSFVESIPRRPMGLNHVLFLFLLTAVLPRFGRLLFDCAGLGGRGFRRAGVIRPDQRESRRDSSAGASPSRYTPARNSRSRGTHPAFWLPCAFLLPQASEDLTGLCGLIVLWAWLSRSIRFRWVVAWGLVTLASLPMSGVLTSMVSPGSPSLAFGWPPTLPFWADLEAPGAGRPDGWDVIRQGIPLVSAESAWVLFTEWGPLVIGGLVIGLRDARRRVLVGIFGVGFLLACGLRFVGWNKSDLDRFLFYGTSAGLLLAAGWVEILEHARTRFRIAAMAIVILPTILGPVGFAGRYSLYWILGRNSRLPTAFSDAELVRLRTVLAAVGPREPILSDVRYAQKLILAGFVVDTPLAPGFSIGIVDEKGVATGRTSPAWLFVPADDPRIVGRESVAEHEGYRLVRIEERRHP